MRISDWSSDVCSSELRCAGRLGVPLPPALPHARGHDARGKDPSAGGRSGMKRSLLLSASALFLLSSPALGQTMDHSMPGMSMPGMKMPAQQTPKSRPAPTKKKAATAKPKVKPSQAAAPAQAEHQGHDMSDMPGMDMQIGRAHVWTPDTNAHLVCSL